jgi:hypothetical protein
VIPNTVDKEDYFYPSFEKDNFDIALELSCNL